MSLSKESVSRATAEKQNTFRHTYKMKKRKSWPEIKGGKVWRTSLRAYPYPARHATKIFNLLRFVLGLLFDEGWPFCVSNFLVAHIHLNSPKPYTVEYSTLTALSTIKERRKTIEKQTKRSLLCAFSTYFPFWRRIAVNRSEVLGKQLVGDIDILLKLASERKLG